MKRVWRWLLGFETISGDGACPVYLYRWRLLWTPWLKIYLHHFVGDDWARDPHDHPKAFLSIGIAGSYVEEIYGEEGELVEERGWCAPWWRRFPPTHLHRIRSKETGGAWTIVVVGRAVREWGFVERGLWYPWRQYVYERGEARKSC